MTWPADIFTLEEALTIGPALALDGVTDSLCDRVGCVETATVFRPGAFLCRECCVELGNRFGLFDVDGAALEGDPTRKVSRRAEYERIVRGAYGRGAVIARDATLDRLLAERRRADDLLGGLGT